MNTLLTSTEFIAIFIGAIMLCDLPVLVSQHFSKGDPSDENQA